MSKQQTRRVLDKQQILCVFAQYLVRKHGGTAERYLADHMLLDDLVKNDKAFPWQEIASEVSLDRWRLYHWYFETFQRMLAGSIEKDDVAKMRDMIKKAMGGDEPLDKQFQQFVKTSLSRDYHRSSFSIAFNNTKRQVMKELGKTELPTARPLRFDSSSEVQQLLEQQQYRLLKEQQQRTQMFRNQGGQMQPPKLKTEPLVVKELPKQEKLEPDEQPAVEEKQEEEQPPLNEYQVGDLFMSLLTTEESTFPDDEDIPTPYAQIFTPRHVIKSENLLEESCLSNYNDDCKQFSMEGFISRLGERVDIWQRKDM